MESASLSAALSVDLDFGLRFYFCGLGKPSMRMTAAFSLIALWMTTPVHAQLSEAEIDWRKSISAQVSSQKEYPAGYLVDGGTTKLTCTIERSGNLKSVEVKDSSGSEALDEKALDLFQRAQPF